MGTTRYVFRDTCRLIFRHWGLSLLTLLTASAVFFLLGGSAQLAFYSWKLSHSVQGSLVMQAYTSTQEAAEGVRDALSSSTDIEEIRLISPQEALEVLRGKLGSQAQSMLAAGDVPLPWSIELKLRDASLSGQVAGEISRLPEVEEVVYAGSLADRLTKLSALIMKIAVGILAIAALVSGLVFYNMIRISIYSRRQEISVMLLVGSTRSYVASPFVLYGMLLGLLGAVVAVVMLHYGNDFVAATMDELVPFLQTHVEWRELLMIDELLLGFGLVTGWFYSYFAVNRYIRQASKPL